MVRQEIPAGRHLHRAHNCVRPLHHAANDAAMVLLFSVAMGSMWLATVPLTSGLVAHMYGIRYMGTLYRFVFLSRQMG